MGSERFDAVVIGTGIGGLCTSALLSHAGYRTLMVEKLPAIGGRSSTVEYKGFKLSTGTISLPTYEGNPIAKTFSLLGAPYSVRSLPKEAPFHCRVKGEDMAVRPGEGLKDLVHAAARSREEAEEVLGAIERGRTWHEPSDLLSALDWLTQYTDNEDIIDIFRSIVLNHHSIYLRELGAGEFLGYFRDPLTLRTRGHAVGGNLPLWESLARAMQERGCTIWKRCRATRILTSNYKVKGLIVERNGEEIEVSCSVVISDTGPGGTAKLVGEENLDRAYLKELRERLRPATGIILYVVTPEDKPLMNYNKLYISGRRRRLAGVRCPTFLCPELAPPGKHLFYATAFPQSSLPPYDFRNAIDLCIQDFRDNFPNFTRYAEILQVECFHGGWPVYHSWPGCSLPLRTPIENLYNVGDGVMPPGWVASEAAAQTAWLVFEDIKQRVTPC